MSRTVRCSCHPADCYGGCRPCPQCGHWSFDPWAMACERRRCGFSVTGMYAEAIEAEQTRLFIDGEPRV